MKIKYFDKDEEISPKQAKEIIGGLIPEALQHILIQSVSKNELRFGLSTLNTPINISETDPDANPDPVAEANTANHRLGKSGSNLRVIVE